MISNTLGKQYGTDRNKRQPADFYETPPEATHALFEAGFVPIGKVWEPACGSGAIAKVIEERGYSVFSTDLYDHGWGESGFDFLQHGNLYEDTIITNPPYSLAMEFILHAISLGVQLAAFLCRLDFMGSKRRYERLFKPYPPSAILIFSWRLPFLIDGKPKKMVSYAWYIWSQTGDGETRITWLHK